MSYEDFLIREMNEGPGPDDERDPEESPGWGEDEVEAALSRLEQALTTGHPFNPKIEDVSLLVTAFRECVHNHVKGRGSSPGSDVCDPAEPGSPQITRADIQTTGEKIPYFGHMRRTK